jgi:hypothetical protein
MATIVPVPRRVERPPMPKAPKFVIGKLRPARDVAPGQGWAFKDHRTMAEVIAEGLFSRSLSSGGRAMSAR